MRRALEEARKALMNGEFPVGCVIVQGDVIVASGCRQNSIRAVNELDHAEIVALRQVKMNHPEVDLRTVTVYSTMEPCLNVLRVADRQWRSAGCLCLRRRDGWRHQLLLGQPSPCMPRIRLPLSVVFCARKVCNSSSSFLAIQTASIYETPFSPAIPSVSRKFIRKKKKTMMNHIPRTVGFKEGERNIFFHILTACNLSCHHCYINPLQHGSQGPSLETIGKWLELFVSEKKSNLIFSAVNRPSPDLVPAIRKAKKLDFTVTVDSNGFLFHDFLQRIKPDELDYLSFSLDGPDAEINDAIRGSGVFAVCVKNLRKAVSCGFAVSVIYTVSSLNINHLRRMVPLLVGWGVKRFFIQVIGLRGKSASAVESHGALQVSQEKWLTIVPDVAKEAAETGIHVTYPKVFRTLMSSFNALAVRRKIILSSRTAGYINVLFAKITQSTAIVLKTTSLSGMRVCLKTNFFSSIFLKVV